MSDTSSQVEPPAPPGGFLKFFSYVVALPLSLIAMVAAEEAWKYSLLFFVLALLDVAFMCLKLLHQIALSVKS